MRDCLYTPRNLETKKTKTVVVSVSKLLTVFLVCVYTITEEGELDDYHQLEFKHDMLPYMLAAMIVGILQTGNKVKLESYSYDLVQFHSVLSSLYTDYTLIVKDNHCFA